MASNLRFLNLVLPFTSPLGTYSSSDSSGDTGVGGSALASISSAVIGQPAVFLFSQTPSPTAPVAVNQVEIVPSQNLSTIEMIAIPADIGDALPGRIVAGYLRITPVGINPDTIGPGRIWFSVNHQWFLDHNVNPDDIVLMRNHDNQWVELPTTIDRQTGNSDYFVASTPGFSYFAIVARISGTASNATVMSSENPVVQTPLPVDTIRQSAQPDGQTLVTAKQVANTTTISTGVSPSTTGSPINWIIAGIISIIVLIGIAFLVRRWWIRRQNPALFREYD